VDLAQVLWIGGATGAGKSSIGRALAYRRDLQLYNVDHRTYDHVGRLPPNPFATLSQDERWLQPTPDELVARFIAAANERLPRLG
jgi:shikimate kinase